VDSDEELIVEELMVAWFVENYHFECGKICCAHRGMYFQRR
jgi:hypothetical protein